MSRGPLTFRQRDLAAAIKAARAAGCEVDRVEVRRDGRIVLTLANGKESPAEVDSARGEWDDLA
jgi:hypothetical protein